MQTQFFASQSVVIDVPDEPVPIQHYLRQPQRLVYALADPSRIEQLSSDCFRLKMRSRKFLALSLQPTVDVRVWTESDEIVHLESVACEIRGVEYVNQRFSLNLVGKLYPTRKHGRTQLEGKADLKVKIDLPPPLWFTPKPLLETAGNGLLKSVLLTVKQHLMHQLLIDYQQWVCTIVDSTVAEPPQGLPASPPTICS
jgi:hypothetical protein